MATDKSTRTNGAPSEPQINTPTLEAFVTIDQAVTSLGLKYHHIQRGIRKGTFKAYYLFGRPRLRISEIVSVIEKSNLGGAND